MAIIVTSDQNSICVDLCCGIGPFVIPVARRGIPVLANDLNPDAVKWLRKNVADNLTPSRALTAKMKAGNRTNFGKVDILNKDGNDVIREDLYRIVTEGKYSQVECLMNLPGGAIFFLPAFKGYYAIFMRLQPIIVCHLSAARSTFKRERKFHHRRPCLLIRAQV